MVWVPFHSQVRGQSLLKLGCIGSFLGVKQLGNDCSEAWQKIISWGAGDSGPAESRPTCFWNFLGMLILWVWVGLPAGLESCSRNVHYDRRIAVERRMEVIREPV